MCHPSRQCASQTWAMPYFQQGRQMDNCIQKMATDNFGPFWESDLQLFHGVTVARCYASVGSSL
eukprot:scaffold298204_cov17-Tisochrysis_lutea.AAC.1